MVTLVNKKGVILMNYYVVIDYGTHRDYVKCHSRWSANMICNDYWFKAKLNGDTRTKFYVEKR